MPNGNRCALPWSNFSPAAAWAFEAEPASAKPLLDFYIEAVKTSDLFVLVLGQHLTKPVLDEYNSARDHGKPILAFSKQVASREPNAEELRTLNSKYDSFTNAVELGEKVRRALGFHMLIARKREDAPIRRPAESVRTRHPGSGPAHR